MAHGVVSRQLTVVGMVRVIVVELSRVKVGMILTRLCWGGSARDLARHAHGHCKLISVFWLLTANQVLRMHNKRYKKTRVPRNSPAWTIGKRRANIIRVSKNF